MSTIRAITVVGENTLQVLPAEIPDLQADDVLVDVIYSGVSPGTELRALAGKQAGQKGWNYVPGYCLCGTVVAAGKDSKVPVGTLIQTNGTRLVSPDCMWGGHVERAVVSSGSVHIVPDGVDPKLAAVAHMIGISHRGVRLTRPSLMDTVAVIGLGLIGNLSARLFHSTGARMAAFDLSPHRVESVRRAGIEAHVVEGPVSAAVRKVFPEGADIVVDATGVPSVLHEAVLAARDRPWHDTLVPGARVVVQGSYAVNPALPYDDSFVKEITFIVPRDHQFSDGELALDLLGRKRINMEGVVSRVADPSEVQDVYDALRANKGDLVTAVFGWNPPR